MAWIIFGIIFSVLTVMQALRLIDRDRTIKSLKTAEANLHWQRESYYEKLQDMTVSRGHYAEMYQDACDEITALNQQVSRLQKDLDEETAKCSMIISRKDATIQELRDHITALRKNRAIVSAGHLQSGLTYLMRFVAANQWMMENDIVFAEAVASVGEVAEAITERED